MVGLYIENIESQMDFVMVIFTSIVIDSMVSPERLFGFSGMHEPLTTVGIGSFSFFKSRLQL